MPGIDVHGDVGEVQLLERVGDAIAVARGGLLASGQVGVGDQVGQRVGLDDSSDGNVGVPLDDLNNRYKETIIRYITLLHDRGD